LNLNLTAEPKPQMETLNLNGKSEHNS